LATGPKGLVGEAREIALATMIKLDFTLQLDNSLPGYSAGQCGVAVNDPDETFEGCPFPADIATGVDGGLTAYGNNVLPISLATAAPGVAVVDSDTNAISYAMGGVSPADDIHQLYGCQPTQDGQPGMCKGLFPAVAAKFPHCSFGMYGEVNNNASCSLKVHLTLTLT